MIFSPISLSNLFIFCSRAFGQLNSVLHTNSSSYSMPQRPKKWYPECERIGNYNGIITDHVVWLRNDKMTFVSLAIHLDASLIWCILHSLCGYIARSSFSLFSLCYCKFIRWSRPTGIVNKQRNNVGRCRVWVVCLSLSRSDLLFVPNKYWTASETRCVRCV